MTLEEGETLIIDPVTLVGAAVGDLEGTVLITGGDVTEQFASLSFRQDIGAGEMIEISSVAVLNTEDYYITLPIGTYSVVAWTIGYDTKTDNKEILVSPPDNIMDIEFP